MNKLKTLYVIDRTAWRKWLENNFYKEKEIWLICPKKSSGNPCILYNDAVEEALCYGWIDSTVRSLDRVNTIQRFSPKNPKSSYSQANKERLKWLLKENLIHPSMQDSVKKVLKEKFVFPNDIINSIKHDRKVWENYREFSPAYKRIRIAYIDAARKRPEEFKKRLANFIEKTKKNKLIGFGGIEKYYYHEFHCVSILIELFNGPQLQTKEELNVMTDKNKRVCPVERAGGLDNIVRRLLQNPRKVLEDYVKEGMTVLDLGCGPGFFSVEMARMVGESGRVIATDLQEGMLQKLKNKIQGTEIEKRIKLYRCEEDKIGVSENVDFVLAFYMVHEVTDQNKFFREIKSILKPNGKALIVEPKLFHVSKGAFKETIMKAKKIGLEPVEKPRILFSRATILGKG